MMTNAKTKELYFLAEAVFTEIEKTGIHKKSRERVLNAISNFRRAVAENGRKPILRQSATKNIKIHKDTTWEEKRKTKQLELTIPA